MNGYAKVADLPAKWLPATKIQIYASMNGSQEKATWKPFVYGLTSSEPQNFGPEVGLAKGLTAQYPNDLIYFIKIACDETPLAAYPGSNSAWLGADGARYNWLIKNIKNALSLLPRSDNPYQLAGMFWMQGEDDAMDQKTDAPAQYQNHLRQFVTKIRGDLASPSLPFLFGKIQNVAACYWETTWPFGKNVQYAQYRAEGDITNSRCMEASSTAQTYASCDTGTRYTKVHYDAKGQMAVGLGFAQAWSDFLTKPKTRGCTNPHSALYTATAM